MMSGVSEHVIGGANGPELYPSISKPFYPKWGLGGWEVGLDATWWKGTGKREGWKMRLDKTRRMIQNSVTIGQDEEQERQGH